MNNETPIAIIIVTLAIILAGCQTTSPPLKASEKKLAASARGIVGTSLIGTKGATPRDQNGIDDAVTGLCRVGSYTRSECRRHGEAR